MNQTMEINEENFRVLLSAFIEQEQITVRKAAKVLTCSEMTLNRIIGRKTLPSNEMIRQGGIMMEIGFKRYSKLSKAEKENISEIIGTTGGGILGFGTITAAVSTLGFSGLSAAGITSGLATLGGIVGGGMVVGISVAAAIPIAAGILGYGVIKGVKAFFEQQALDQERYDPFWEKPLIM
jgi:hypothetical protein